MTICSFCGDPDPSRDRRTRPHDSRGYYVDARLLMRWEAADTAPRLPGSRSSRWDLYWLMPVHASSEAGFCPSFVCNYPALGDSCVTGTAWLCLVVNPQLLETPSGLDAGPNVYQLSGIGPRPGAHGGGAEGRLIRRQATPCNTHAVLPHCWLLLTYRVALPSSDLFAVTLQKSEDRGRKHGAGTERIPSR